MRFDLAAAMGYLAVVLTGCSGGGSGTSDSSDGSDGSDGCQTGWSGKCECSPEDTFRLYAKVINFRDVLEDCEKDCWADLGESCVTTCLHYKFPSVSLKCLSCPAKLSSCEACAKSKKLNVVTECTMPYSDCTLPEWPNEAQCTEEEVHKMGEAPCLHTNYDDCPACGYPGNESCLQDCYTKQCPDVPSKCVACFSKYDSCWHCEWARGWIGSCFEKYDVCRYWFSSSPAAILSEVAV